ncbi:FXYD domain containing ion transport regulator 5 [Conger conger]|uniref:FXYD domain containing ion transport regulator 5 n=1 Tax=Conger conger TaxID=82655 RepID=UPI002A5AED64|nr:FXYD domain containing ion transport regulator 5 [Conger conger]
MGNKRSLTMEFWGVYLCLSVTLGGCTGQLSMSIEGPVGYTLSEKPLPTTTPTPTLPENTMLMTPETTVATQGHSTEGPSADDNGTSVSQNNSPSANATESSGTPGANATITVLVVTSDATTHSTRKKTVDEDKERHWGYQTLESSFSYDYSLLRRVGLGMAFLFFMIGILVIASSRVGKIPKWRKRSGKTYEVTRV